MIPRDIIGGAPLLRPLVALIAGVFLAANVPLFVCVVAVLSVAAVALVAVRKALYASTGKSLLLSLLFVVLGMVEVWVQDDGRPAPFPSDEAVYECRLTGDVYHRGKTWRAHAEVLRRMDSVAVGDGARTLLYLADTAIHANLKKGDCIYVRTSMSLPAFNEGYRDYLLRNNVCGTGYVAPGNLCVVGHDEPSGVMAFAAQCRRAVHGWYASLGFEGDELAILSALTIGLRDGISDELNEAYSISGLAHVLSLSGLHVGLIFFVLQLLLRPMARTAWGGVAAWVLLTAALLVFAVFTGLSSPVVRSCFMMSAFGFAILTRRGTSLNALCVVALAMVVWDYRYLYDVSFQMSFMAVFFILLFYAPLSMRWQVRSRVLRYVKDTFVISLVAQMGVAPIVAFTFGTFSVYGIVSSVVVVPFLSVLMYVAIALLMLSWLPWVADVFVAVVGGGLRAMNWSASFFSTLPLADARVTLDVVGMTLCYGAVIALLAWMVRGTPVRFRLLGCAVAAWAVYGAACHWAQWRRCEVEWTNTVGGVSCRLVDGFASVPFVVDAPDTVFSLGGGCWQSGRVADLRGVTVMRVDTAFWQVPPVAAPLQADCLWLCRGARGRLDALADAVDAGCVILDSGLSPYYRRHFASAADSLGLAVVDMASVPRHAVSTGE